LVLFVTLRNAGPGAFFWSAVTGVCFLFIAPAIQWMLLRTKKFHDRTGDACFLSLALVSAWSGIAFASGLFDFW